MNDISPLALIRERMREQSADGLADAILLATRDGSLEASTRLPTIAELSEALGLSSATISRAWSSLRQMGIIETRKRGGTIVRRPIQATSYRARDLDRQHVRHALAAGYPDPELLVDLRPVVAEVAGSLELGGYPAKDHIAPRLHAALLEHIGYEPDVLSLESDVLGTLPLVLQAMTHRGASVALGDPDFPVYGSILQQAGVHPVPIPFDEHGYDLDAVRTAVRGGVRVLLLQTRVQNPTGLAVPTANLERLAALCEEHGTAVIEVDHHSALVPEGDRRLAAMLPDQVVLLTSFAKAIHPDVRVIAASGPEAVMHRLAVSRMGGRWVSGIAKAVLEACLTSESVRETIERARAEYARRRAIFVERFARDGLDVRSNAGVSLWLPVADERETHVALAARGVSVALGTAFTRLRDRPPHIHVSLGSVGPDCEPMADLLARSAQRHPQLPVVNFL